MRYEYNGSWYTPNELCEIWKPILGYEGYYEVSNFGRVRSVVRTYQQKVTGGVITTRVVKSKVLAPACNQKYLTISLHKNGDKKTHAIHKLVAKAFLPNPNSLPQVNHKDENKWNNRVDNLEWCTAKYNTTYGTLPERKRSQIKGENNPQSKLTENDVREIRRLRENGLSNLELSKMFGVSSDHIYQIVTKRRWKHVG